MRRPAEVAAALAALAVAAPGGCTCGGPGGGTDAAKGSDASVGTDASVPDGSAATDAGSDAGSDAAAWIDASVGPDAGACDPSRTMGGGIATGPIAEGSFCDEVVFCVDASQLAAVAAGAPGFVCTPGGYAGPDACLGGEYSCQDQDFLVIDAGEMAQICAVTVLPVPPDVIYCMVYGP